MSCEFCGDGPTCVVCGKGLESTFDVCDYRIQLDHFAGLAMQGIIAGRKEGGTYTAEKIAKDAYKYARAMMQERQAHINLLKIAEVEPELREDQEECHVCGAIGCKKKHEYR